MKNPAEALVAGDSARLLDPAAPAKAALPLVRYLAGRQAWPVCKFQDGDIEYWQMDNKGTLIATLILGFLALVAFFLVSSIASFGGEDTNSPDAADGTSPIEDGASAGADSGGNQPSRPADNQPASQPAAADPIGALPDNWARLNVAEKSRHNPYNCLEAVRIRDDNGRCMVSGSSAEYVLLYQLTPQQAPVGQAGVLFMAVPSVDSEARLSDLFSYLDALKQRGVLSDAYEIDARLYNYADVRYAPVDANNPSRNWQVANLDSPRRTYRLGSQPAEADDGPPPGNRAELEAYLEDAGITAADKRSALEGYCREDATAGDCLVWTYYDAGVEESDRRHDLCQDQEVFNDGFCGDGPAHRRWQEFSNETDYLEAEAQSPAASLRFDPGPAADRLSDRFLVEQRTAIRRTANDIFYYFLEL